MLVIVGASLTLVTVNVKVLLAVKDPSLTVNVTVLDPDASAAGVKVAIRFAPLPPNEMFATGKRAGFEDAADNVRPVNGVSISAIVNNTEVVVSSGVV